MRTGGYLGLTADDLSSCSHRGAGHAQPGATGAVEELSGHQPECTSCPWCCRAGIVKKERFIRCRRQRPRCLWDTGRLAR